MSGRALAALLLPLALALGGCDLSMARQAKHEAQSAPRLWANGPAAAPLPAGTVSRDRAGEDAALLRPPPVSLALIQRGRERYGIYCAPCHGGAGRGDGIVVQRGFPHPPAYTDPRVLALSPAQIVGVIIHGYGIMYGFDDRVSPRDRWAIAAYVKALQRADGA